MIVGIFTIILMAIMMYGKVIKSSEGMIIIAFIIGVLLASDRITFDFILIKKVYRYFKSPKKRGNFQKITKI